MPAQIIPTSTSPNQDFDVSLSVDGGILQLHLALGFSEMAGYWVLTISDQKGNLILNSIPLLTGSYPAANILGQYGYLKLGSWYVINTSNLNEDLQDYPRANNLSIDFNILVDDTAV